MTRFFRPVLLFLLHLGYFGPVLLGILDSSFLFAPFGNDLLVVILIAKHHHGYPFYVLAAATGSTIGVLFLDFVARRLGEPGIEKLAGKKRFQKLREKTRRRTGVAIVTASLLPPPFPFTLVIATASALKYSRGRLLAFNWCGRAARFAIVGALAIEFGQAVTSVIGSDAFRYTMICFVILCLGGSAFSVWKWVRHTGRGRGATTHRAPR